MIKISNLEFSYPGCLVFKNLNCEISDSQWTCIIGANGSGKSTLAKLLVGLIYPKKGKIEIDDLILDSNPSLETINKLRKKVGIVFQNPDNQFVGQSVKYDIAFGLENRCLPSDEIKEKVLHFAEVVGLSDKLDRDPSHLSGGEKQRCAIASCLALNYDTIIFDEATAMLDPMGKDQVISLIKELNEKYHKNVITITHDLNFARQASKIIILNKGSIYFSGEPKDAFTDIVQLRKIGLDIPDSLKLLEQIKDNEILNSNKKLKDELWKLFLTI